LLEDRRVLAAISWDGGGGDLLWSNSLNWSNNQLPGADDDVTINAAGNVTIAHTAGTTSIRSLTLSDSLTVNGGTLSVSDGLTVANGNTLTVSGGGVSFEALGAAAIDGVSLIVNSGSLSLSGATNYAHTNGNNNNTATFRANGSTAELHLGNLETVTGGDTIDDQFVIEALSGGRINLGKVTDILDPTTGDNRGRAIHVKAEGSTSRIDLSSLKTFIDRTSNDWNNEGMSSLTVTLGGEIHAPLLETLNAVQLNLNGNGTLPIAQIKTLTGGAAVLSGASYAFPGLTDASGTAFTISGNSLDLQNVVQFAGGGITVNGAAVDMRRATNLEQASVTLSGGSINLDAASSINGASFFVNAGALSLPSARNYAHTNGNNNNTATFRANGSTAELHLGNLETVTGGDTIDDQFVIEALSGGRINLGKVTDILDPTTGDNRGRAIHVKAEGSTSRIDLSSLKTFIDRTSNDWNNEGMSSLTVLSGGMISFSGAILSTTNADVRIDSASLLTGGTIDIGTGANLTGQGEIFGSVRNSGGTVSVGKAPTGLTIHGEYTQTAGGRLVVAIDGAVETNNYSQLIVDGKATLAGTLEITRAGGYSPDLFTDYAILQAETVAGTFGTVTGGTISGGDLAPQYGTSGVALSRSFARTPIATFPYQNTLPNQRTFFNVSQIAGGRAEFRLYDPTGKLVGLSNATAASPNAGDFGTFLLKDVGAYEVRVYGALGENPTFVATANAAPLTTQPGFFRKATSGEIATPGAKQAWEFDARVGDEISLDVLNFIGAGQQLSFTLRDPEGRVVYHKKATAEAFNDADFGPFFASMDGIHTLTVDGVGDDTAAYQFLVAGPQAPRVRSHALKGPDVTIVNEAWFLFDQAMDTTSFSLAADLFTFQNPSGPVTATGFRWQDATTLVITFAPQPADVPLFMALAPTILNAAGVGLDQDGDRIPGEATEDQYLAELIVDNRGPFVIHTEPGSTASAPIDRITFHFSEPIDAATFSLADVTTFTGPGGVDLRSQLTNFLVGEKSVTVFFNEQEAGGQFTIAIGPSIADAAGNQMDQSRDGVNGQADDKFQFTTNVQSPDLVVASVTNPVPATHGQDVTLTWTVQNNGADPATGTWWDYVYLSADDKWDLNDALVAKRLYTGDPLAENGGNYQASVTAALPGVLPGNYRVLVRTNILENLTEATQANNTGVSANAARFELPALTSGVVATRNVDFREELYYKFEVPADMAGGSLILKLGTSNTGVANELYVSRGVLPTRMKYDARSQQGLASNQYIILSALKAGTYYVLGAITPDQQVGPNTPLGTANLQAELLVPGEFRVLDANFGQGGTAGNRTIEINGANFDRTITARLTDSANASIPAVGYYRIGPESLYATFDLTAVAPGTYSVVFENLAGQVETVANSMEVVANLDTFEGFAPHVTAPPAFGRPFHSPFAHFPTDITWANNGLNDIPVPVIIFASNEPFAEDFESNVTGSGWNQTFHGTNSATFFAFDSGVGVPGVLLPGQQGGKTYEVVPRLAGVANEAAVFALDVLYDDPANLFNWDAEQDRLSGSYLSQQQFEDLFFQFRTAVGPTQLDYVTMLASTARLFKILPEDVFEATRLLTQEAFARFTANQTASIVGQIDYSNFDIDFSQLEVVVTNRATLDTFTAPVRLDGRFALSNVGAGTFDLAVRGGAVAVGVTPIVVSNDAPTDVSVQVLRGGEVQGSVLSPARSPVVGASLALSSEVLGISRILEIAADGSFTAADLSPGDYVLTATANGRVPATMEFTIDFGGDHSAALVLEVAPVLSGAVRGTGNVLVSGAQVRLTNSTTGNVVSAITGDDGRYSFDGVPAGTWDALVSHPQYQDLERTISVSGPAKSESFTLAAGAVVNGRIVSTTGTPVEGAVVGVVTSGTLRSVITGADGIFTVAGLAPGDAQLQIDTVGFARSLQDIGAVSTNAPTNLGDVTLSAGLTLASRITNGVGTPIANAIVMLESNSGLELTSFTTGADGFATFTTLSPGIYRISVASDGYASRTTLIEVTSDEQQVDLQLSAEATLSGSVAGAGDGLVALYQNEQLVRWAVIGTDGQYSINKLAAGDFVVAVLHASNMYLSTPITVDAGSARQLDFSVATGSLKGIVSSGSGAPIAGATVVASWVDSGTNDTVLRSVETSTDGSYSFAGLGAGDIALTVFADDYAQRSATVGASAGLNVVQNVSLTQGVRATGSVEGPAGETVTGASLYLIDPSVSGALPISSTTSVGGSWVVEHISPGTYRAIVLADGYTAYVGSLTIADDGSSPDISLTTGGFSVAGVVSIDGVAISNAVITVSVDGFAIAQATTDASGHYEIGGLATGSYTIQIDAIGAASANEVVMVDADTLRGVDLASSAANQVLVFDLSGVDLSPPPVQARAAAINLPSGEELQLSLDNLFLYREVLNREYARVTTIPFASIPDLPDSPTDPDCFCNSDEIRTRAGLLNDIRRGLQAEKIALVAARALAESIDAALRAGANATYGVASTKLFIAVGKYGEYSDLKAQLDALVSVGLVGVTLSKQVALALALKALLESILGTLSSAQYALDTFADYIQSIESNKQVYNTQAEAFQRHIDSYNRELKSYERDLQKEIDECPIKDISAPSGSATVVKGETTTVDLLPESVRVAIAKLTANGTTPRIVVDDNPFGSGVSIRADGVAEVGDGNCGTFTVTVSLVIECNDSGIFGYGKDKKIFTGTFTVTRTPIHIPIMVNCPDDAPDDTDCYKYDVTYSGDCSSFDPNDITGPRGAGAENWIAEAGPYAYTIGFENDAEKASAPARVVRVTQLLDSDLDYSSFRLGTITFGDVTLREAVGLSSFETRLDYRDTLGTYLDIRAGIDLATGEAFWELQSVDPVTGEVPFNPLMGFLPPNANGVEGQGYLGYSIRPKSSLVTGAVIDAQATIVFDQNEPIETPAIFNTIDAGGPTSQVTALASQSVPGFLVQWTGADDANGSGVSSFDVYVSTNDGPFELWLARTMAVEARYDDATPGITYAFYSVAIDRVGHVESAPAVADATTFAVEPQTTSVVNISVTQTPQLTVTVEFADPMAIQLLIDSGAIRSAVSVVNYSNGPIDLTNWQFAYDAGAKVLSLTTADQVPGGLYELRLDGDQFLTDGGVVLRGGASGLTFNIPGFAAPSFVQAGGADIATNGDSTPIFVDWNSDGLTDLVVGERTATNEGKIRVYLNHGTNAAPSFTTFTYAQTLTGDLVVPGASDMGVSLQYFDWNGDDEKDLVLGLADGRVQLWTNVNTRRNPFFGLPEYVQVGAAGAKADIDVGTRASVDVVDWNNDGKFDLVAAGDDGTVRVYLNAGTADEADFQASFTVPLGAGTLVVPSGLASIDVVDLNGDRRKDLVAGNRDGQLYVYLNEGWDSAPSFRKAYALQADGLPIDLNGAARTRPFVADYNNDGLLDLVVGAADGKVRVYSGAAGVSYPPEVVAVAGGTYAHAFEVVVDTTAPQIDAIAVRSTSWDPTFTYYNGYNLNLTGQPSHLPWSGVNQVKVTFSEDVVVSQESLWLHGVNVADYEITGFSYSAATHTATWTLATAIGVDKLIATVDGSVTDALGNPLQLRSTSFNVAPGDVDGNGSVAVSDIGPLRAAMGAMAGKGGYNPLADVDGSGSVSVVDTGVFRGFLGQSLPSGEPTAMMFAMAFASAYQAPVMIPLVAADEGAGHAVVTVLDAAFAEADEPFVGPLPDVSLEGAAEPVPALQAALLGLYRETPEGMSSFRSRPAPRTSWNAAPAVQNVRSRTVDPRTYDTAFDAFAESESLIDTGKRRSENLDQAGAFAAGVGDSLERPAKVKRAARRPAASVR